MAVASREDGIMEAQQAAERAGGGGGAQNEESVRHIVFFDVETNVPGRMCRSYELLEFGAVVLDVRGLGELGSFHTLIRPKDLSCIDHRTSECNTITPATVVDAPCFADVAEDIYLLLHGHIWAGHNILKFDILRVNEAFSKIGRQPPQPFGVIDTYPLLRKTFGKRAGNYKLETLANYCGYGKQEHRSIADVRMNIDVLRSCATMLFLESNYPDILMSQMEVTAWSSVLVQSAASTPCRETTDELAEQEAESQPRLSNQLADASPISIPSHFHSRSRLPFAMEELSEVTDLLKSSRLISESKDAEANALASVTKENAHSTFSTDVREAKECVASQPIKISACISKTKHVQEDLLTGYEHVIEKISRAEVMDAKSAKVESFSKSLYYGETQIRDMSIHDIPILDDLEKSDNEEECDLSKAILSLSLKEDVQEREVSGSTISNGNLLLLETQPDNQDPRTELRGVPFFLASHVSLPSIELREEPSSFGCSKVLYYEGFPLHLLEFKVRVRFTINLSYAFDEKGKPRFSILLEPSESACNVISKCEYVVKTLSAYDSEVEWLPALRNESGCCAARMSIGTKWGKSFSTYTTEFFRRTSKGLEKLSLGHVDASTFRNVIPHGCCIDVGFGFRVFNVNNRAGVKLLANHITLT